MTTTDSDADLDHHIEGCDTCGDGTGVCLEGYLLAASASSEVTE